MSSACFFGHRLFRVVLALFGFIFGALAASSMSGPSTRLMLVAARVGGLVGAGMLLAAYFVGVALVGAGLARWSPTCCSRPAGGSAFLVVVLSPWPAPWLHIPPALLHHRRHRFGGAWTLIVGAMALLGDRGATAAAAAGHVWVVYPLDPAPGADGFRSSGSCLVLPV